LIVKAINGQLMVGKYAPPKPPPPQSRTPTDEIIRPLTPAPLFAVSEEEGTLFSPLEEEITFPRPAQQSHDQSHDQPGKIRSQTEKFQDLLRAIENFDG